MKSRYVSIEVARYLLVRCYSLNFKDIPAYHAFRIASKNGDRSGSALDIGIHWWWTWAIPGMGFSRIRCFWLQHFHQWSVFGSGWGASLFEICLNIFRNWEQLELSFRDNLASSGHIASEEGLQEKTMQVSILSVAKTITSKNVGWNLSRLSATNKFDKRICQASSWNWPHVCVQSKGYTLEDSKMEPENKNEWKYDDRRLYPPSLYFQFPGVPQRWIFMALFVHGPCGRIWIWLARPLVLADRRGRNV